jgi:hypothetical protein
LWLIEVNSSPDFGYSTPVTKRLVKMVSEDIVKLMVDRPAAPKKQRADVDVGLWECIHKAKSNHVRTVK